MAFQFIFVFKEFLKFCEPHGKRIVGHLDLTLLLYHQTIWFLPMGHKQTKMGKAPRSGQNPDKHLVVYVEDAEHKTIHWFGIFN